MKKIVGSAKVEIDFTIDFTVTKGEAKALDAIVGYGIDAFLKVFYEHLGKSYLEPHEKELRNLFTTVKEQLPSEIYKIENAEEKLVEALRSFK